MYRNSFRYRHGIDIDNVIDIDMDIDINSDICTCCTFYRFSYHDFFLARDPARINMLSFMFSPCKIFCIGQYYFYLIVGNALCCSKCINEFVSTDVFRL